jgi:hypothetical protein
MVYRLLKIIDNRDERHPLAGMIEFNQGYTTIESSEIE